MGNNPNLISLSNKQTTKRRFSTILMTQLWSHSKSKTLISSSSNLVVIRSILQQWTTLSGTTRNHLLLFRDYSYLLVRRVRSNSSKTSKITINSRQLCLNKPTSRIHSCQNQLIWWRMNSPSPSINQCTTTRSRMNLLKRVHKWINSTFHWVPSLQDKLVVAWLHPLIALALEEWRE